MEVVIYKATQQVTKDFYIGVTCKGMDHRRKGHVKDALKGGNGWFHTALREHGPETFYWEVLERLDDYTLALKRERALIAELKPKLNRAAGGQGAQGWKHTDESKRLLSISHQGQTPIWTGKKRPPEVFIKMVATRLAKGAWKGWPKGKARTADTCAKISAAKTGVKQPPKPEQLPGMRARAKLGTAKLSRPIMCVDDGKTFPHMRAAATHYDVPYTNLQRVVKRGRMQAPTVKGLSFVFIS